MFASAHLWRTWPGGRGSQHLCYHGNESLAGCKTCWPACRAINRLLSAESDNFAVNSNAADAGGQSETLASPPRRYSNCQTNVADFSSDQSTGFCGLAVYRPREKSQTLDIFCTKRGNSALDHLQSLRDHRQHFSSLFAVMSSHGQLVTITRSSQLDTHQEIFFQSNAHEPARLGPVSGAKIV